MKGRVVLGILVLPIWLYLSVAGAEPYERGRPWKSDQPWEKLSVTSGYFLTSFTSDVKLSSTLGGVVLSLEDLLGLDATTSQYRIEGHYRAWRRHHFHFGFFDLSRDADRTLAADIPDQDPPVQVGTLVNSLLDIKIFKVGHSYSFWNDERLDLGAGIGFYVMDLAVGIDVLAEGSAGGEEGSVEKRLLGEAITLPLPVLGLRGNVALTKRVFLKQSVEFFYISIPGFRGFLLDANLAVEGHICRFFGLGLGYNFMRVNVEGDGDAEFLGASWNGRLHFDYSGVYIYAKFFF